jgi:hypothetical protein
VSDWANDVTLNLSPPEPGGKVGNKSFVGFSWIDVPSSGLSAYEADESGPHLQVLFPLRAEHSRLLPREVCAAPTTLCCCCTATGCATHKHGM